jgi:acetyl-CoA acetyltransferase
MTPMRNAYIIGSFSTAFGRWSGKDHRALARDAVLGVLEDAGLADGSAFGQAYFGNCLMHMIGQTMIRGQTCLSNPMDDGVLPERLPIVRYVRSLSSKGLDLEEINSSTDNW